MLKRTLTGILYCVIVIGFILLREFVDYRIFDVLIWFIILVGTFELVRALKIYLLKGIYLLSIIYGVVYIPHYYLTNYFSHGYGYLFNLLFTALICIAVAIYSVVKKIGFKRMIVNVLPFIYPSLLMFTLTLINGFEFYKGFIGVVLVFVISPLSDTVAYLVGSSYNKLKKGMAKKMCPVLSPKKTWAGTIGGVVGGAIGSLLVYLIFKPSFVSICPIMFFIIIGIFASILDVIGDLFESYIKRRVKIKDMGNILPGHGGILDRFDGMMFTSTFIFIIFLMV